MQTSSSPACGALRGALLVLSLVGAQLSAEEGVDPWRSLESGVWIEELVRETSTGGNPPVELRSRIEAAGEMNGHVLRMHYDVQPDGTLGQGMSRMADLRHTLATFGFSAGERRSEPTLAAGRTLDAEVHTYTVDRQDTGLKGTLGLWVAKEAKVPAWLLGIGAQELALPANVVRVVLDMTYSADSNARLELEVSAWEATIEVAGKPVTCIHFHGFEAANMAGVVLPSEVDVWISSDVPGNQVRSLRKLVVDGQTMTSERVVTAFGRRDCESWRGKDLTDTLRTFYRNLALADPTTTRETLGCFLPNRGDLSDILTRDAETVWMAIAPWRAAMLESTAASMAADVGGRDQGFSIEQIDCRGPNTTWTPDLQSAIRPGVEAYRVRTKTASRESESGTYLKVRGRWVWIRNLEKHVPPAAGGN